MAITTEIDLTLESDFASEFDKRLKPDRARQREDSNLFSKTRIQLSDMILRVSFNSFFQDGKWKEKIIEDTLNCYYGLFGMSPKLLKRWGELDSYAPYFFGAGIFCDCCGVELNLLNSDVYLCSRCNGRYNEYLTIV